jgi:hypothetical protein
MAGERWDYVTLRPIPDPTFGRTAYNEGEGIMAQVVEDLGLVVGVDVKPAQPDAVARPAGNASRSQWAAYRLGQGADPERIDAMTRDELRDMDAATESDAAAEETAAEGAEPTKGE